jgi:hypothetical protein
MPDPTSPPISLAESRRQRAAAQGGTPAAAPVISLAESRAARQAGRTAPQSPARSAATSFIQDFDVDMGGADSFTTMQAPPPLTDEERVARDRALGPRQTLPPAKTSFDLWNEKEHSYPANLLVGFGETLGSGASAIYHGVRDPLRAYSDQLFERNKWRAEHQTPQGPQATPSMSSVEPPTPSFVSAAGHAAFGAIPAVALTNAATSMPAEQVAKSRAEGVDPGVVGDVLAAPQEGLNAAGDWARRKIGGAAQTIVERAKHNQLTPEIDMNADMDLRPVYERGVGPAFGEAGSFAAQMILFKAAEALPKVPDAIARTSIGERLMPERAAAQVPLAEHPATPIVPEVRFGAPEPPRVNFTRPPEPVAPAAPPTPAGPGVMLPGSAPPTVPVNPRNPLAVGLAASEGLEQRPGIPAPETPPITLGEAAGASKIPPLAKREAAKPPAPAYSIDQVIDATQPPVAPPKAPEKLPDAIKATELQAEEHRGKAEAHAADRRRAQLAALPHDQLLEMVLTGEQPKPAAAPPAPPPPVVETPPAEPQRFSAAQERRAELQQEHADNVKERMAREDAAHAAAEAKIAADAQQAVPAEHPQAAMLRTEAENYKTDDYFGKAAHDGFLRVAAGEPIAKVVEDIRKAGPEPSPYAEEIPGRTKGDDAAEHFESNVRAKLGEKNPESRGPASGPAANAGVEKKGPESAQPSAEQATAGEGAAARSGAAPAPVPPEPVKPVVEGAAPASPPATTETSTPAEPAKVIPSGVSFRASQIIRKAAEVEAEVSQLNAFRMRGAEAASDFNVTPEQSKAAQADLAELRGLAEKNGWKWEDFVDAVRKQEGLDERLHTPDEARAWKAAGGDEAHLRLRQRTEELSRPGGTLAPKPETQPQISPSSTSSEATKGENPAPQKFGAPEPVAPPADTFHGANGELRMKTADVGVDAARFQHKESSAKGLTERLKKTKKWEEPTEPLSVWRDPVDGKVYVVNGHQRMGLAERVGQPDVPVKFIEAKDAAEARLEGAKENLRSGHASPADTARFFREQKLDPDAADKWLESIGATDTAPGIREGRALAALPDSAWSAYLQGEIRPARAVAFGDAIRDNALNIDQQLELVNANVKDSEIPAFGRRLKMSAESSKAATGDLFGDSGPKKSLIALETKLQTELLDKLSLGKRQFGSAGKNAEAIEAAGMGKLDKAKALKAAADSKTMHDVVANLLRSEAETPIDRAVRDVARDSDAGKYVSFEEAAKALDERVTEYLKTDPMTKAIVEKGPKIFQAEPEAPAAPDMFSPDRKIGAPETTPPEPPKDSGGTTLFSGIDPIEAAKAVGKGVAAAEKPYATVTKGWLGDTRDAALKLPGGQQVSTFLKDWFRPEREASVSKEFSEARALGKGKGEVARAEGTYFGEHLGEELKDVPDAAQDALYEYLGSEADAPPAGLSGKALDLAQKGSDLVNEGRRALVSMGRRSADALNEYPRFLVRFMQNVELAERARSAGGSGQAGTKLPEQWSRQDAHEMRVRLPRTDVETHLKDADLGVDPQYVGEFHGHTLVKFPDTPEGAAAREAFVEHVKDAHAQARSALNQASTKEFASRRNQDIGQGKMLHKASLETPRAGDLGITTADPLSPEMRDLMGEDRNPATALARTIANVRSEVAKAEMFQAIRDGSDAKGAWAMEPTRDATGKTEEPPKGFTHVSSTRLGALHDIWLRQDVWDDLKGVYGKDMGKQSIVRNIYDVSRGLTDELKTNLTIRNPANQIQNWISMPTEAIEAGFSLFNPENWPHIKEAIRQMHEPYPFDPMQREILEQGIDSGAQMAEHEIGPSRDVWSNPSTSTAYKIGRSAINPAQWVPERFGGGKVGRGIAAADQRLGSEYNRSASIIRRGKYMKLRAEGLSPEAARADVNKFTTNYEQQGRFINEMRKLPVSPFITYPYERMRIFANNLIEHPTRAAWTLFGGYALKQMLQATLGSEVSDEEKKGADEEYGKSRLGELGNQYAAVTGRNEDGSPRVWDTGALFTLDRLMKGPEDALDESALLSGAKFVGKMFGMEAGPVFQQGIVQLTGRDYYSGKELLTLGDRAASLGKTFAHPLLPYVGSKAEKIRHSFKDEPYAKTKPPISPKDALLDALLHIRIDGYVPQQSQQNLLWALDRAEAHDTKLFDAELDDATKGGATDDDAVDKAGAEYSGDLEQLYQRFGEKIDVHNAAAEKTPAPKDDKGK